MAQARTQSGTAPDDKVGVFISYSRKDLAFIDKLDEALAARGYDMRVDRDDIEKGEDWWKRITDLITGSDIVLFIISPDSVSSDVCEKEVAHTVSLGKRIVPVVWRPIDGDAPPSLAERNWIFANACHESGLADEAAFAEVLEQVERAIRLEDIMWVREHTKWIARAAEWDDDGRSNDMVLRAAEITEVQAWASRAKPSTPPIPQTLTDFINASVARETRDRGRLRAQLIAIGVLVLVSALVVAAGAFALIRTTRQEAARRSISLAQLSQEASDARDFAGAARLALAGLAGSDAFMLGFDPSGAEAALARAVVGGLQSARLVGRIGASEGVNIGVAASPDGASVAIIRDDEVALWDAKSGQRRFALEGIDGITYWVDFNRAGDLLATADHDGARLWNPSTGALIVLLPHEDAVTRVLFSPDGARLLTVTGSTIHVWDVAARRMLYSLAEHTGVITDIQFSPNGARLITSSDDRTVRLWDVLAGQLLATRTDEIEVVYSIALSPDGSRFATGSADGYIRVWSIDGGAATQVMHATNNGISALAFFPDGRRLFAGDGAGDGRIWDANDGALLTTFSGHTANIWRGLISPDGALVMTGSLDQTVRVWDGQTGAQRAVLRGHGAAILSMNLALDKRTLITSANEGAVLVWDIAPPRAATVLSAHTDNVGPLWFTPDGSRLLTGAYDRSIMLWDTQSGEALSSIDLRTTVPRSIELNADGSVMMMVTEDKRMEFRDVASGEIINSYDWARDSHWPNLATFARDGRVATAESDGAVIVWQWSREDGLRDGESLLGHREQAIDVAFSPDGRRLVSTSTDRTARIWDIAAKTELHQLRSDDAVLSATFSPDGALVATGSYDRTVRIFDAESGRQLRVLRGHTGNIYEVQFSPDGARLVSASADRTAIVWDVASGRVLAILEGHGEPVIGAMFSPDGRRVGTTSEDHTARLWDVSNLVAFDDAALREMACGALIQPSFGADRFGAAELGRASMLDPAIDQAACSAPGPWTRLGHALMGGGPPRAPR